MRTYAAPDVMRGVAFLGVGLLAGSISAQAALALAPPGASSCSGCHASAHAGGVPPIRGRKAEEIAAAMAEFRSGARPATLMDRIAKGFSDEETRAIANWLAERAQ